MRICCGRGTSSVEAIISESTWAGEKYLEYQKKKMQEIPKEKMLAVSRGTRTVSLEKYPKSRRRIPESGYSLVISRGTKILRF